MESMDLMSVRIDTSTKRRMAALPEINWAEVIRNAVRERLDLEEELRIPLDKRRARRAARRIDSFRGKITPGRFDSTTEVRKWRELRK